jgi:hypothetical protein
MPTGLRVGSGTQKLASLAGQASANTLGRELVARGSWMAGTLWATGRSPQR